VRCPSLAELPPPPPGRTGWPWTEETPLPAGNIGKDTFWPRITIVTPSFNQGPFIEETIRSILLQGYPDIEYFVLDGGSTDNTVDIIKKYSPWLGFWVSGPDGGQSAAINRGLRMGTGLHATWINSDDLLCRSALVNQACSVGFDDNVVYVGDCLYVDGATQTVGQHRGMIHSFEDLVRIREFWRAGGNLVQAEVLFPRERALAVGGLNEANHFTMDYELWGRFLLDGVQFRYTKIPFGMFRHHQAQKTHDAARQTQALIETAERLLTCAENIPDQTKDEIRADLRAYFVENAKVTWTTSGRLARLGLPASLVMKIRKSKNALLRAARNLGINVN
jgi:glycosyltransferase involved in cell wall biosynthesis